MEAGFGGPVWHASIAPLPGVPFSAPSLRAIAMKVLDGVGDASLGQWEQVSPRALHIRRRVSDAEWAGRPWGHDLRGTDEAKQRLAAVAHLLPPDWDEYAPPARIQLTRDRHTQDL